MLDHLSNCRGSTKKVGYADHVGRFASVARFLFAVWQRMFMLMFVLDNSKIARSAKKKMKKCKKKIKKYENSTIGCMLYKE